MFRKKFPSGFGYYYPRWFCFLFSGNYRQKNGGFAWTPGVLRLTYRYYKEGWRESGYSWWDFVWKD